MAGKPHGDPHDQHARRDAALRLATGFPGRDHEEARVQVGDRRDGGFSAGVEERGGFSRARLQGLGRNANENPQWLANPYREGPDDLGDVYGVQWRKWPAYKVIDAGAGDRISDATNRGYQVVTSFVEGGREQVLLYKAVDQLRQCLDTIIENPTDRRILFHAWNPAKLDEIALPACHLLYQFIPNAAKREISLCLYIRSNDVGLGTPFNLTEGAALLHLVGRLTGYAPRWFTYFIGDAHVYENQLDMLNEQLTREPFASPQLILSDRVPDYATTGRYEPEWLEKIEPSDFALEGYRHHEALKAPMAV